MIGLADRVKETTTSTGTGTIDLGGAVSGYQTFVAGIGTGNTCYYCIAGGAEWEIGIGTVMDASPDTLSRTTILSSSNSGSAVNFSSGSKNVFCMLPAVGAGDQSWSVWSGTNFTSGKAIDTVYQNTSGRPMIVMVNFTSNAAGLVTALTDSSNPPTTQLGTVSMGATSNSGTLQFIVENNHYYKVTGVVGSIQVWSEYVITRGAITKSSELHASRSPNTAYQNTSGSLMLVSVQSTNINNGYWTVWSDANSSPTTEICRKSTVSTGSNRSETLFFPVLPGHYYKIDIYVIDTLYEYTWSGVIAEQSATLGSNREPLATTSAASVSKTYLNGSDGSLFVIVSGYGSTSSSGGMQHQSASYAGFATPLLSRTVSPVLSVCAQTNPGGASYPKSLYAFVNPYETYAPFHAATYTCLSWYEWKIK